MFSKDFSVTSIYISGGKGYLTTQQGRLYRIENGELSEVQMYGLESRIFQHEYDHMEGTNFTAKVSKLKLDRGKKRVKKVQKKSMISMT